MGNNIFVSYKYSDSKVLSLHGSNSTTARNYVDEIETLIDKKTDHFYRGEHDGEDLSKLSDEAIESKLRDRMFYTSVTIVLVSKGMKENKPERDQWIPWEISYSLKEQSRESGNSTTNAVLAVVLPDENGKYDYYITEKSCGVRSLNTEILFNILKDNMFNVKNPIIKNCNTCGGGHYHGDSSYINSIKWSDFKSDINNYINKSNEIKKNKDEYNLTKKLK